MRILNTCNQGTGAILKLGSNISSKYLAYIHLYRITLLLFHELVNWFG